MPLAFPSHQGLIAPLWRRWPGRFSAVACCIGAAAPDLVDGAAGLARGRLGQSYGHSLLGLFVLCLPVGFLLTVIALVVARRSARPFSRIAFSVWVGALSHVLFDLVSHDNFLLFLPWYAPQHVFPDWWTTRWIEVSVPGYHQYPIGPHFVAWVVLSVVGAVMFFWKGKRPTSDTPPPAGSTARTADPS